MDWPVAKVGLGHENVHSPHGTNSQDFPSANSSDQAELIRAQQSARRQGTRAKKLADKKLHNSRASRLGGELLSCMSEFLASRNVINKTERYEKLGNVAQESARKLSRQRSSFCSECQQLHNKWPTRAQIEVKKFNQFESGASGGGGGGGGASGKWRQKGKHQVGRLLADLLSGRHGSRFVPLVELLRAPIVLAALFSFILALSLFTLYTLSFHHCQTSGGANRVVFRETNFRNNLKLAASQLRVNGNFSEREPTSFVIVQTECGSYEGAPEGGSIKFRGVAYASPPIGARRWQKPRPIWLDESLCGRNSNWFEQSAREHCVQLSPFNHRVSGSEDCLYLDIYTPATFNQSDKTPLLPVMVYVHGGFLVFGSNGAEPSARQVNWARARPSGQLASELNVVLVAPNYRLQALGFMALKQLALDNGPDGSEGNYGLWDQLAALRWIRRNIGSFGGDPNNVLLFGPDSASALPLALLSRQFGHGERAKLSESPTKGEDEQGDEDEQLFHSVWLMNPTIYYELPYELANQHYLRLIRSQSVCSNDSAQAAAAPLELELAELNQTRRHAAKAAERRQATAAQDNGSSGGGGGRLIECLMELPAERVVREYLGRDDAAFRLDDENSLPIRNIFPDQFVTLDGQLVRDSFPFLRAAAAGAAAEAAATTAPTATTSDKTNKKLEKARKQTKINFLVGSTAQAVGFWPCPRNLHDWTWADFRHYVSTSLNSFNQADTFQRATELYQVPPAECANSKNQSADECRQDDTKRAARGSPVESYLTMVSDIRQVCPVHELVRSLQLGGRANSLERYLVEWRPSAQLAASLANENSTSQFQFAFHYWDLIALFGLEQDPQLAPSQSDLEFQRHIRSMAKRLAWSSLSGSRFTIFTLDEQVQSERQGDEETPPIQYKERECRMWQQSLKQSYAWIS